jgi:hypothetical protein
MRFIAIVASLALASCSQVGRLRTDISAPTPALGPEVTALRNNLAVAFVEKDQNQAGSFGCKPISTGSGKCLMFRTDGTQEEVDIYLRSAFTLTNSLCDDFFRSTNAAALHRQNVRTNINDVGTFVTAILGISNAGSIATSAVASATGFGDGLVRNYDASYLVTPDLATLQPLVRAEQVEVRKSIMADHPATFETARDAALRYAEPCTYLGMKRLLTKSVQLQTVATQKGFSNQADAVAAFAVPVPAPKSAQAPVAAPAPVAPAVAPPVQPST